MQLSREQQEVIQANKKAIEEQIHRSAVFQRVFSGADGEYALKEIAGQCFANSPLISVTGEDPYNPIKLAYRAKGKDLWMFIQKCINQDVEQAKKNLKIQEDRLNNAQTEEG